MGGGGTFLARRLNGGAQKTKDLPWEHRLEIRLEKLDADQLKM